MNGFLAGRDIGEAQALNLRELKPHLDSCVSAVTTSDFE
jgi:hypothetical protein